jgi:Ca2+-dependent lipid-binding protein
MDPFV